MASVRSLRRLELLGCGAAWLGLFCVNVLGIWPWTAVKFPTVDLAEMVYEVRRLQLGYVPYLDTFTHHFIGYVLPFYALASVVKLTPLVLKMACVSFNFVTAVIIFLIVREITRSRLGWLGAFLAITVGWFWNWQGFGFNVQSYLVPVLSLTLLLIVSSCTRASSAAYCLSALVAGVLLTFDQRAALFVLLLFIPPVFVRAHRRVRVLAIALGALALAPGLCMGLLWRSGAAHEFFQQTFVYPVQFRNHGMNTSGTAFALSWCVFLILGETVPVMAMLLGLSLTWAKDPRPWLKVLCLATFVCGAGYSMAGGRLYSNYLLIFSPLALIMMTLIVWYARGVSPNAGVAVGGLTVGLAITAAAGSVFSIPGSVAPISAETDRTADAMAAFLHDQTSADDPVLVWGFAPQIYVESDRFRTFRDEGLLSVAGANFSSTAARDQGLVPDMVREFEQFLTRTPPRVIVAYGLTQEPQGPCAGRGEIERNLDFRQASYLTALRVLVETSYHSALIVDGPCDHAEAFIRNGTGGAPQ